MKFTFGFAFLFSVLLAAPNWILVDGNSVDANSLTIKFPHERAMELLDTDVQRSDFPELANILKDTEWSIRLLFASVEFGQLHIKHSLHQYYVLKFEDSDLLDLHQRLGTLRALESVEFNYELKAVYVPDDPYYSSQWAHNNTGQASNYNGGTVGTPDCDTDTDLAWDVTTGDGTTVAILDTGVNENHEEFAGKMVNGWDFVSNDPTPNDVHGHGTACAGIAAGQGDNGMGIAGVSWESFIMGVKVLDDGGSGSSDDIAAGIEWASSNGADVISMSLSGGSFYNPSNDAINFATENGTTVLAATGNDNASSCGFPSAYENCVAVGALSPCNERKNPSSCDGENWWGSNYGEDLDFLSPGVRIHTTNVNGGYMSEFNGTSSACPHAAGIAALIKSVAPNLSPVDIRTVMQMNSVDLYSNGWDSESGYGRLNAYNAVTNLLSAPEMLADLEALEFEVVQGGSDTQQFTIANIGDADLQVELSQESYFYSDSQSGLEYDWIDISDVAETITIEHNDLAEGPFALDFEFPFYGNDFDELIINPNGWIGFSEDSDEWNNTALPNDEGPLNAIMPYWDDLNPVNEGNGSGQGTIRYHGNDERFVVWFDDVIHWVGADDGTFNFQLVLYPNGDIRFNYADMQNENYRATIGMQNADASDYLQLSYNTEYAVSGSSVLIRQPSDWLSINPESATIEPLSDAVFSVTCDATNLTPGSYSDLLQFETNDYSNHNFSVEISLTVNGGACWDWDTGDVNNDDMLNVLDVVNIINHILEVLPLVDECAIQAADVNSDAEINVLDVVVLVAQIVD